MLKKIKNWFKCHILNEHEKSSYYGLDENYNVINHCKYCFKKINYSYSSGNWEYWGD